VRRPARRRILRDRRRLGLRLTPDDLRRFTLQ
jgi:hypothetical protein